MGLKVDIIGTAPSRAAARYGDLSREIWAQSWPQLPRWDRWFETHDLRTLESSSAKDPGCNNLVKWLRGTPMDGAAPPPDGSKPVYLKSEDPLIAGGVAYPRDEVIGKLGPWGWSSTVAWELGLAIVAGAEEIGLFGIEMADDTEYARQKKDVQNLIARAKDRGIKIEVPEGCELLSPGQFYGLGYNDHFTAMVVRRREYLNGLQAEVQKIIADAEAQIGAHRSEIGKYEGAITGAMLRKAQLEGARGQLEDLYNNWR